jgi:hypothetical protein
MGGATQEEREGCSDDTHLPTHTYLRTYHTYLPKCLYTAHLFSHLVTYRPAASELRQIGLFPISSNFNVAMRRS